MSCVKLSNRLAARIWTNNLQLNYELAARRRAFAKGPAIFRQTVLPEVEKVVLSYLVLAV
jgi:hypothetical protein